MPWAQDLLVSDQFQQDSRIMIQNDPAMVRSCVPKRLEPAFLGNKETSTLLNQKHPLFFVLRWFAREPQYHYEFMNVSLSRCFSSVVVSFRTWDPTAENLADLAGVVQVFIAVASQKDMSLQ